MLPCETGAPAGSGFWSGSSLLLKGVRCRETNAFCERKSVSGNWFVVPCGIHVFGAAALFDLWPRRDLLLNYGSKSGAKIKGPNGKDITVTSDSGCAETTIASSGPQM